MLNNAAAAPQAPVSFHGCASTTSLVQTSRGSSCLSASCLRVKARAAVMTPRSSRTLHHPTFMPLYREARGWRPINAPVPVMNPTDFYYTDPTLAPGQRVSNTVTQFEGVQRLTMNTPPPIMSARPAPPIQPDPFLPGPHPTRDLGSRTWNVGSVLPKRGGTLAIIQMSQEEDDVITSLLQLCSDVPVSQKELDSPVASSEGEPLPSRPSHIINEADSEAFTSLEEEPGESTPLSNP